MKSSKRVYSFVLLMVLSIFLLSCSKTKSPVEPSIEDQQEPIAVAESNSNRSVLAVYDAVIDTETGTFEVTPSERSAQYHYPLTRLYPDVLTITRYGFTPNFWADIRITHPLPNSGIDGFDPRVIAILPANPGVSMSYPNLQVLANNSVVLEPDGYTKLYDNLGGSIPGNTNPFLAYFKQVEYRRWFSSGTGMTSDTRRWDMDMNGFGGPMEFKLVVDVSLNYPEQPQQVIDNAREPIEIVASIQRDFDIYLTSQQIAVTLFDWQGASDIRCAIESPALFANSIQLSYSRPGPNPNEYLFSGLVTNSNQAPAGNYKVLIAAWDITSDTYIFDETTAVVSDQYPVDGELVLAKREGSNNADHGYGITRLSDNSIVMVGEFIGLTVFGRDEPNETVLHGEGDYDILIARFNPDGTLIWAKRAGGNDWNRGYAVTGLSDNSTIITGFFYGEITFGEGEPNETVLSAARFRDIFIARYNPDGTLAWAKRAGGDGYEISWGVTALTDNSSVITGYFTDEATFGPGEANETVLSVISGYDAFIARYNPDGTLAWVKQAGGLEFDNSLGITSLSDNSTVVTGVFESRATFGPGELNETVLISRGGTDISIAKYNPDGTLAWAKSAGGISDDYGQAITLLSDNSTVVTGYISDISVFGAGEPNETVLSWFGESDIFVARYNPDGTLAWVKHAGGSAVDKGLGITSLSDNSTVITGDFSDSATFGPGEPNQTILTSAGNWDIFVARYNPDGSLAWAKCAGGIEEDQGQDITTLSDDTTVVTGEFRETITFGLGESNEITMRSNGLSDVFLARFAP